MNDNSHRVCVTSGVNLRAGPGTPASLRHAVRTGSERAVCSTKPGKTAHWLPVDSAVTCPNCLRRLSVPGYNPLIRGPRKRPTEPPP